MQNPPIILTTSRLTLRTPQLEDDLALQVYEEQNRRHFAPWRGSIDSDALQNWVSEHENSQSFRFFLFQQNSKSIIGQCNFTHIIRGPFQACYLGYHIDQQHEGKGLMKEALEKAIHYMFKEQNLHRIMANYMPANLRSAKLLQKLGFVIEGKAANYLLINGYWEDHILTALTNERWHL